MKKGVPLFLEGGMPLLTCLENTAMSSLKDSDEQTSPPATEGSRGVHVANSHFSKMRAKRGKSGCLKNEKNHQNIHPLFNMPNQLMIDYPSCGP